MINFHLKYMILIITLSISHMNTELLMYYKTVGTCLVVFDSRGAVRVPAPPAQ
jgi:hypothetical protein